MVKQLQHTWIVSFFEDRLKAKMPTQKGLKNRYVCFF